MTNTVSPQNPSAPNRPLFFQRRFWPLWMALSFGTFADNTLRQALVIGVTFGFLELPGVKDSDNILPYIGALLPLGILSFSFLAGQLADKYETSLMFRRTKFAEISIMLVAGYAFLSGNGILAVLALFIMGAQSAFFSPVRVAAMPKYLSADELVRGNGLCNAGLFTFILLGYAVGGSLIATKNGGALVAMVLVGAALVGWASSLMTINAPANDKNLKIDFNIFTQTFRMGRYVLEAPGALPPLLGIGLFFFLTTAVTIILPLFTRDTLGADAFVATALNGLFAIGAGIGAMTAASLARGRSGLGFSTAGIAGSGFLTVLLYFVGPFLSGSGEQNFTIGMLFTTPTGIVLSLTFIATSALMGLYIAPLQAALQRRATPNVRAQILSTSVLTSALFAIPGSLAVGLITRFDLPAETGFLAVGTIMLLVAAYMMTRRSKNPQGLYDEMLSGNVGNTSE